MDVDEEDLIGQPLEEVPKQDSIDERCMGKKKQKRGGEVVRDDQGRPLFAGYCGSWPGKGTDHVGDSRCSRHGGCNSGENGQGGTEDNTNAVTHGAYADHNSYYQDVLDDAMRAFVDDVFDDYLKRYREQHGDPPLGIKSELFRISVTHAKDIGLDRWADEKPDGLESGHPLVDKETKLKTTQHETFKQVEYSESVVLAAQKKLSNDRRMWLKDLGLLEDPESQKAGSLGDLADVWRQDLEEDIS